ncbi:MAG: PhoH family protein [Nitrospinales bacterium]
MNHPTTREITLEKTQHIPEIFGPQDQNLKLIEKKFNVRVTTRENQIKIKGESSAVEKVIDLLTQLEDLMTQGIANVNGDIKFAVRLVAENEHVDLKSIFTERIALSPQKGFITPKSPTQREFIHAIKDNDITLAIGPAGTGKTFLAVAMAVEGLLKHKFQRIILVRPAVEAGEKLGFLPGTLSEKINPYLMPLYDALYHMVEYDRVQQMIEDGIIEIAPLAYMRGRTLNDSFIILDEGQNSTQDQMKMFLTRLGFRSKMVATGDITQVDLARNADSGLIHVQKILKGVEGIRFVYFSEKDVVRHNLVKQIIKAYDKTD